jgi:hypothetical protein
MLLSSQVFSQVEFYECPREKKQEFISDALLIPRYKMGGDTGKWVNSRIDPGNMYVFKQREEFECGTDGHFRVIASLYFTVPMGKQTFELNIEPADSLKGSMIYFTGCGCMNYFYEMKSAQGTIKGTFANGKWNIKGSVSMRLYELHNGTWIDHTVIIDGSYILWKQKKQDRKNGKFIGF